MNKNYVVMLACFMVVSSALFAGKLNKDQTLDRKIARFEKEQNQKNPENPFGKSKPMTVLLAQTIKALEKKHSFLYVEQQ